MSKMRKTLYQNNAIVFVNGSRMEEFETSSDCTAISKAEDYVSANASEYKGKQVEVFVKVKEYRFEEVKTMKVTEV